MGGRDKKRVTHSARNPLGFGAPVSPSPILRGVVERARRGEVVAVVVRVGVSRRSGRERDDADCMLRLLQIQGGAVIETGGGRSWVVRVYKWRGGDGLIL